MKASDATYRLTDIVNSDVSTQCLDALQLPHDVTAHMKVQSLPVLVVSNVILDLSFRDRLGTSGTELVRSITSANLFGHYHRQVTVLDKLADAQP